MDVYSIASKNPKHKLPDDTIFDAIEVMVKNKFRRIPIVDIERPEVEVLVGIITASDLMRLLDEYNLSALNAPLGEVMMEDPIAVIQNTSLGEATMVMTEKNFGGLPIIEDTTSMSLSLGFHSRYGLLPSRTASNTVVGKGGGGSWGTYPILRAISPR